MKDLGALGTGRPQQGEGTLDDDLREAISKKDKLSPSFSDSPGSERFGVSVIHRQAGSSVPFKWEEAPGKARASCRDASMSRTDLKLQLPPRLQFSHTCEIGRVTDQALSRGKKTRARQLNRRYTIVLDSRNRIGQMKSYIRSLTTQPRTIRCDFARNDSEILVAAPVGCPSSAISEEGAPDSPETDAGAISRTSSRSSWCPDLSPDGDGAGADNRTRRRQAMERLLKFLSSWVAVQKGRRKFAKGKQAEMWSPTLATYLYNTRREEAAAGLSKVENWVAHASLKQEEEDGDVSYGGGNTERETEGEASLRDLLSEREDYSSSDDGSPAPKINPPRALSRPKRVFMLTKTVRLLVGRLHPASSFTLKREPVNVYHS